MCGGRCAACRGGSVGGAPPPLPPLGAVAADGTWRLLDWGSCSVAPDTCHSFHDFRAWPGQVPFDLDGAPRCLNCGGDGKGDGLTQWGPCLTCDTTPPELTMGPMRKDGPRFRRSADGVFFVTVSGERASDPGGSLHPSWDTASEPSVQEAPVPQSASSSAVPSPLASVHVICATGRSTYER